MLVFRSGSTQCRSYKPGHDTTPIAAAIMAKAWNDGKAIPVEIRNRLPWAGGEWLALSPLGSDGVVFPEVWHHKVLHQLKDDVVFFYVDSPSFIMIPAKEAWQLVYLCKDGPEECSPSDDEA
ncbi:MAG: hypothetical protein M0T78_10200 [Actinomycetota bacterium]|nr:hypothetical protein [Actinomycetota bacterium]